MFKNIGPLEVGLVGLVALIFFGGRRFSKTPKKDPEEKVAEKKSTSEKLTPKSEA